MTVGVTDLAHSIRANTVGSTVPISLSHGQQLVCAALGYKTLAAFQAAQTAGHEPRGFDRVAHVVLDHDLLAERARQLGLALSEDRLRTLLRTAFEQRLPETKVHRFFSELAMSIQDGMQDVVMSDDDVNSAMANANYNGIVEVYFEEEVAPDEATLAEPLSVTIQGHVALGLDLERPYAGHQVRFKVAVTLARYGRRCFDVRGIEMLSAGLDYNWNDDEPPRAKTQAQALIEELGIELTETEAEELNEVEADALTGNSGEMTYSYLFDFTGQVSPELAAKLMKHRGSLKLEVGPSFFEILRGPDGPF